MNIGEGLTLLSRVIFLLLSGVTTFEFVRHRDAIRRDIALMFGSIATLMALQLFRDITGQQIDAFSIVGLLALIAQPYLLNRLIQYFKPVPNLINYLAFGGMIYSWVAFILFAPALPSIVVLTVAAYFVIINGYAMYAFIHGAFAFSGVTRHRFRLAAVGSGLVALILGLVGLSAVIPSLRNVTTILMPLGTVAAAVSYYVSFASPLWLRQTWQYAELRDFLVNLSKPDRPDTVDILNALGLTASRAVGGVGSMIIKSSPSNKPWIILYSSNENLIGDITVDDTSIVHQACQNPIPGLVKRDVQLSETDHRLFNMFQAETLTAVPIGTVEGIVCLLLVFLQSTPLFPDDDLELLRLLAQQSAIFLENTSLIEQLQSYSGSLEEKVEARTRDLVHSEERFRTIFEQVGVGLVETSVEGKFIQANQRFCEIVGYSADELRQLTFQEITHPNDLQVDLNRTQGLLAGEIPGYSVEKRYIHKSGRLLWVNVTTSQVHGSTHGSRHLLKAVSDISDRKQAEAERLKAETRFARVLETTAEAVISIDTVQRIILFNQSAERIFGYTSDEVLGQSLDVLLPQDVIVQHRRFIDEFAAGDDRARGMGQRDRALFAKHKDGTIFPIEASISKLTEENQVILTVFMRDITEQKEAEAALRESEQRYHTTLDTMLEGCQIIGFDWRYIYVNESAARYGHQLKAELLGHTIFEKYPGFETTEMYRVLRQCMEERAPRLAEFEFVYPDGTVSWFEFSVQPVPEGIFILSLDITERKKAEEALLTLNEELERRVTDRTRQLEATNKELEAFSYSVSHDLRAPLRALDGFSQALLEDYEEVLDDDGKEYLTLIRMESQRMGQLIDDLLNLSRLTRTELTYEMVNLSTIVHEIAQELQAMEPTRKVAFSIEEDLLVCADARLMRVALQNLVGNAWKYTSKQPTARIEFGCTVEQGETIYFVRDNGVGFNMSYAHKLFGAFQRLHAVTEFEGNGIGLATVQRIIHQHGGAVRAHGVVQEGASFFFTVGQLSCE